MTSEERKEALRYLPKLWHGLVQVLVQSRYGEKTCTTSKSPKKGSAMFNVEINSNEQVTKELKKFIGNQVLTPDNPFSLEFSLMTSEKDKMVLEIWTLSFEENYDSSPLNICQITERMSILLKSVICVSRAVPAYKYSFMQSTSNYVLLFKAYTGKPCLESLGVDQDQVRIGQTNIQCGYLTVHLAYRTNYQINAQPRKIPHELIMVKSDHFKIDSSPKRYRKTSDRVSESSETVPTSDDSQDLTRFPFNCSMDLQHSSPRSRTSSESSYKGTYPSMSEKIFVPFATKRTQVEDNFPEENSPSAKFLASAIEKLELEELEYQREEQEKKKRLMKERLIFETESEPKEVKGSEKTVMNTSGQSNKSHGSNAARDDEFVLLDMKTPFADTCSSDFNACLREWQSAPPLKTFSDDLYTDEDDPSAQALFLKDQLKSFESHADEYDELVKSFHMEDLQNSHEELG